MGIIRKMFGSPNPATGRDQGLDPFRDEPRSYAALYPDVPLPGPLTPKELAAQWTAGKIPCEKIPAVLLDLLERGFDTPALRRAAAEPTFALTAEAEPFMARVFPELGVEYPMKAELWRLVVSRQIAREVIAGKVSAWDGAARLFWGVWNRERNPPIAAVRDVIALHDCRSDSITRERMVAMNSELVAKFAEIASLPDAVR
jgi:hypothetical protein